MESDNISRRSAVPIVVDLAFASNVRFLDDHELHLDNVELYKVSLHTTVEPALAKPSLLEPCKIDGLGGLTA